MALVNVIIILIIILVLAIIFFKVAKMVAKVLLAIAIIALIFALIFNANEVFEDRLGIDEEEIQEPELEEEIEELEELEELPLEEIEDEFREPLTTEEECTEQNGLWQENRVTGEFYCNEAAEDANEECSDSEECEYLCIYNETSMTGFCQPNIDYFGCFKTLQEGEEGPELCID